MPENDAQRLEIAAQIRALLATEDVLLPAQARSFVRCLQTSWDVQTIQWSGGDSVTQLSDAKRLIHAADIYSSIEGWDSENARLCYRRAGELLEWLARSGDDFRAQDHIELLAAAAFQLGGLPAMASSLLSLADLEDDGELLYSRFLQADFDAVVRQTNRFWRQHPELTDREAPARLLNEETPEKLSWYITTELVRCIGLIADTLRRGDDNRLAQGLQKLKALDAVVARTFSEETSLLVSLLHAVARNFDAFSIYKPMVELAAGQTLNLQRLRGIARNQFSRGRGVLWSSQRQGLKRLVAESSFALCTPTGSGKTLVANLALVKELLLRPSDGLAPLALYLVPSRALAGEVEAKLQSELGRELVVTGLYGGTDWGVTDYWLTANRPTVLIATVEKADALMRYVGPTLLSRLRLLVLDEAHQVVPDDNDNSRIAFAEHSSRPARLEILVSRLFALSPNLVRIALTAVAGGAAGPVARWIEGRPDAQAIGGHYRSTRQIVGTLETSSGVRGRLLLELRNGRPLYVRGRDEPVYIRLQFAAMPRLPSVMRNSVYRFNELTILWTALHLSDAERRVLISVAQEPEQTMSWYRQALELEDWASAQSFEPPDDPELRARFDAARACCIDYCGEGSNELALLDRGIATNHGQMPQRLRRLMVDLIDKRICPITVATATLTEGVNLPFDIVFVSSLRRTSFNRVQNRQVVNPISTAEFRNLAGRAGRPGSSSGLEGLTLVAVPQRPSTTAQAPLRRQRRQVRTMQQDYESLLTQLIAEQAVDASVSSPLAMLLDNLARRAIDLLGLPTEEAFMSWLEAVTPIQIAPDAGTGSETDSARLADTLDELDGVLLSAIEELNRSSLESLSPAGLEQFLASLWATTFTRVAATQQQWLERAFIKRGSALVSTVYPDAAERQRIYQSGFAPVVARRFSVIAPTMRMVLSQAADYGAWDEEDRIGVFETLAALVAEDRGFGFRVRDTAGDRALYEKWGSLLRWWMRVGDETGPEAKDLRAWQRFVGDNFEFRLGVAVGAVAAQAWFEGETDPFDQPTLSEWKSKTGLPWIGFWARELLRWGTVDPFVAFALSQGLAGTREVATRRRTEFDNWLQANYEDIEPEDAIDPQLFLEWQSSLPPAAAASAASGHVAATLTGTNGVRGIYSVTPFIRRGAVHWLDAAGFVLATSVVEDFTRAGMARNDYELRVSNGAAFVQRTYTAH
jgi:hypothetical protein